MSVMIIGKLRRRMGTYAAIPKGMIHKIGAIQCTCLYTVNANMYSPIRMQIPVLSHAALAN